MYMTEEKNDIINNSEEKAPKEVVIPEFFRDLKQDEKDRGIWHYVFRTNGDRKPIKTPRQPAAQAGLQLGRHVPEL
jgi:hypothetical protein